MLDRQAISHGLTAFQSVEDHEVESNPNERSIRVQLIPIVLSTLKSRHEKTPRGFPPGGLVESVATLTYFLDDLRERLAGLAGLADSSSATSISAAVVSSHPVDFCPMSTEVLISVLSSMSRQSEDVPNLTHA